MEERGMDAGASTVINILVDTCTLLTLCSKGDKVLEVSVSDGAVMSESLALIRDALSCGRSLTYSSFKIRCTLGDFGDRKVQKKKTAVSIHQALCQVIRRRLQPAGEILEMCFQFCTLLWLWEKMACSVHSLSLHCTSVAWLMHHTEIINLFLSSVVIAWSEMLSTSHRENSTTLMSVDQTAQVQNDR